MDEYWNHGEYWNHNVHYHPWLIRQIPRGARRALDVGCGDGLLAALLASHVEYVMGVDSSPKMVAAARARVAGVRNVEIVVGDVMTHHFDGRFDYITAVASVHHLDLAAGLARFSELLADGGRLTIVGLSANTRLRDYVVSAVALPAVKTVDLVRRTPGSIDAPVRDPRESLRDITRVAETVLGDAKIRRRLMWRYSLVWDKPSARLPGRDSVR